MTGTRDNGFLPGERPRVLLHVTALANGARAPCTTPSRRHSRRRQAQIWLFIYNSGNPIAYSGGILVESLRDTVAELDPEGRDPALRRMLVAGHSQGGLLTRLTAVNSGDRFWQNVSDRPIDSFELDPETDALLRRSLFFERRPFPAGVTVHSIIPVKGDGPLEDESDGVVRSPSAHLDEADSERVVRHSGHSVQERPEGIQELRRILLEHLAAEKSQTRAR